MFLLNFLFMTTLVANVIKQKKGGKFKMGHYIVKDMLWGVLTVTLKRDESCADYCPQWKARLTLLALKRKVSYNFST